MLIYPWVPAPAPDAKLASERYAEFFHELFALLTQRRVQIALMLFLLPSSSFALTNVLGGIGADFSASERLVGLLAGAGSVFAGLAGSLLLPPLARKFALRPLYLGIGIVGAVFTLSLLLLPRVPWTFAVAITGENLFQALANATAAAIVFETMGPENPFAATLFSLLLAGANFAIFYMGLVDGRAYTWRGITGGFAVDAGISATVCLTLGSAFFWNRSRQRSNARSLGYTQIASETE
jgi:PAT family beta-lactamase induction signal transducer AmpG